MSAESEMERLIEATILSRKEVGAGYSPTLNRLRHMSNAEVDAYLASAGVEEALRRERRTSCTCYPRGFISMSPLVKAQMKADHIAAGRHSMGCPMWVDKSPMYSRAGDSPPSYTQLQERRDAAAEQVDR